MCYIPQGLEGGNSPRSPADAGGGARDGGCGAGGREECWRASAWVLCLGDREYVLGGVRGGDREPVRDGDVHVLLGDGGLGGGE